MPHVLFGFRQSRGKILPVAAELKIVKAVLHAPPGTPVAIARLTPTDSYKSMSCRVARIRKHRFAYKVGRPMLGLPPDPALAALVATP